MHGFLRKYSHVFISDAFRERLHRAIDKRLESMPYWLVMFRTAHSVSSPPRCWYFYVIARTTFSYRFKGQVCGLIILPSRVYDTKL